MRKVLDVNKAWRLHVENEDDRQKKKITNNDIYMTVKMGGAAGYAASRFDDSEWREVDLPHDRKNETEVSEDNIAEQGGKKDECVWYRKKFEMPESLKDKHFTLVFEGISIYADIYFNGSLIGKSTSPYAETVIDLTPRMHFGSKNNVLAVRVDGLSYELWCYEGVGIYRSVKLYVTDALHIGYNGIFINPQKISEDAWEINAEITLENSAYADDKCMVTTEIYDDSGKLIVNGNEFASIESDSEKTVKMKLNTKKPKLWDPDSPNLYKAVCKVCKNGVIIDESSVNFGFRTFKFDGKKGFFLNDKHIKIKGAACHPDHGGLGNAVPEAVNYYRIKLLKEMGTNAYRCGHNWHNKEVLDACDKYGILVMDENRRFETYEENLKNLRTMIKRDRNHPSVIMWSLYNEETMQGSDDAHRVFCKLKSEVEKLDPSKAFTGAMHHGWFNEGGEAFDMDVVGFNYNMDMMEKFHEKYPDKPIFGAENNSALSMRGIVHTDMERHELADYDDYATPWGNSIQDCWAYVKDKDYISGIFIWTGFDYHGEPTPFSYPSVKTFFGAMDICGFPKTRYYVAKACFTDEPMMHIFLHWNHKKGEIVKTITVTNCDEVELILNKKSLGKRLSEVTKQCVWEIPFEEGELKAIGYRNGDAVAFDSVKTAGVPKKIKIDVSKTTVTNDGYDAVAVNVSVTDKNGVPVATADNLMKFSVTGGKILGVENGDENSHEPDVANQRKLFCGKCQMIAQIGKSAEKFEAVVESDGLESARIVFDVINKEAPEAVLECSGERLVNWGRTLIKYDKKPNPNMKISLNDMNTFVPVNVENDEYQIVNKGWTLYRTFVSSNGHKSATLAIGELLYNEFELWVNEKLIASGKNPDSGSTVGCAPKGRIEESFEIENSKKIEINLLVRSDYEKAGIAGYNDRELYIKFD